MQKETAEQMEFLAGNTGSIPKLLENEPFDRTIRLYHAVTSAFEAIQASVDQFDYSEGRGANEGETIQVNHSYFEKSTQLPLSV